MNVQETKWRVLNSGMPTGKPHETEEEAKEYADGVNRELERMGSTLRLTVREERDES